MDSVACAGWCGPRSGALLEGEGSGEKKKGGFQRVAWASYSDSLATNRLLWIEGVGGDFTTKSSVRNRPVLAA